MLRDAIWALMMPVIILGGILSGVFTATEAGVAAVVYALLVGMFVYRDLKWPHIKDALVGHGHRHRRGHVPGRDLDACSRG